MRGNLAARLYHLVETHECAQEKHLRSVWGHDRLKEHLRASVNLIQERKKSLSEVGVEARHLLRVAHPETFQGKNPSLSAGLGIGGGRKATQAACSGHAQRRQPRSTIHVANPLFKGCCRVLTMPHGLRIVSQL